MLSDLLLLIELLHDAWRWIWATFEVWPVIIATATALLVGFCYQAWHWIDDAMDDVTIEGFEWVLGAIGLGLLTLFIMLLWPLLVISVCILIPFYLLRALRRAYKAWQKVIRDAGVSNG